MFEPLRRLLNQINATSTAACHGQALLARIDAEAALMAACVRAADRSLVATDAEVAGLLRIARLRLQALREAAIAARALRPEHIHHSAAAACLRDGAHIAPMLARLVAVAEPDAALMAQVA